MELDRSSFTGVFSSRSESWLVEQTPVMACITPWSQSAQEASLSSRHPSWKLLLISKCHKFHSLLFLGALTIGGEWRGGRRCSFFLSPSLLKRKLDVGTFRHLLSNPFDHYQVLELNVLLVFEATLSADSLLSFICWDGTPKLSLHDAALSPRC